MKLKNELPYLIIVAIPFVYLAFIWKDLPEKVPMHWNINGEIDRFGSKIELIPVLFMMPVLVYLIMLIVPKIDPKGQIKKMGNKYGQLKFLLISFMSFLALFIVYSVKKQTLANPNFIIMFIGVLYIILGNYFKTIKANYFIGIRTPWTLENEAVWKATHKLAGKLWFTGGLIIILLSLILNKQINFYVFLIITGILTIVPVVYSYFKYKSIKNLTNKTE